MRKGKQMGRPKTRVTKTCLHCGKEFEVHVSKIRIGAGKFCSVSCATTHRNIFDNPTKKEGVKEKISQNHADVSGKNNPMYMRRGEKASSYIDGRSFFRGEKYRKILLASGRTPICSICQSTKKITRSPFRWRSQ